jgi:hypothetical protein
MNQGMKGIFVFCVIVLGITLASDLLAQGVPQTPEACREALRNMLNAQNDYQSGLPGSRRRFDAAVAAYEACLEANPPTYHEYIQYSEIPPTGGGRGNLSDPNATGVPYLTGDGSDE